MAVRLHRLGAWACDHRKLVVTLWVAVLIAVSAGAALLHGSPKDAFTVPGTQAQRALELLNDKFPEATGATARIVFAAPEGHTLDEARYGRVVEPTVALARRVPQAVHSERALRESVTFSRDRRIAFADLRFTAPLDDLRPATKHAVLRVAGPARSAGLDVEFSGGVTTEAAGTPEVAEIVGLGVALVVALITFGTFAGAILPIITALVGVAIGLSLISAASGIVALNSTAPTLASMLGLAVGIDYALFIVSRHRQNLAEGMGVRESIALANGTAGGAVIFAGITVVIALVGMLVLGIPFVTSMGLAASATVVVAVLVAITLLPALLAFAGTRVTRSGRGAAEPTLGHRWGSWVVRHPVAVISSALTILVVFAIPLSSMRLALPDDFSMPRDSTEHRSAELLSKGFGPGFTGPLLVVGDASKARDPKAVLTRAIRTLGTFPGVASVSSPAYAADGKIAVVEVAPKSSPDSKETRKLVELIRSRAAAVSERYGIHGYVTGPTAVNIDTSAKIAGALPRFLVVIGVLAILLLLVVFRSIAVPIKAVAGFLLSIAAALGVTTWVFQEGHLTGALGVDGGSPIVSFLPVLLIACLFGLSMDYEVFLVSRMRESYKGGTAPTPAVVHGFTASARVVTAAAVIMIAVFLAFLTSEDLTVKAIAFSLAFGVLVDAFLVRMTLVPAVLALLQRHSWTLPKWLDRRLPHVDIEGEGLRS